MKFHTTHKKLIVILVMSNIIFATPYFTKQVEAYNGITAYGEIEVYDSNGVSPLTSYDFPLFLGGTSDNFHRYFFINNTGNQPVSVYWNISASSIDWEVSTSQNFYEYYENGVLKYSFAIPQDSTPTTNYWNPNTEELFLNVGAGINLYFELYYTGEPITSEIFTSTISFYAEQSSIIPATVNVKPNTLNLMGKGRWVSCYIEFFEHYEVNDIDFSSIKLNDTIEVDASAPITIEDYNKDGMSALFFKFDRNQIIQWLGTFFVFEGTTYPQIVILQVTGDIQETSFKGYDTIKIIIEG